MSSNPLKINLIHPENLQIHFNPGIFHGIRCAPYRFSYVRQFLSESVIYALSILTALILTLLFNPAMNVLQL